MDDAVKLRAFSVQDAQWLVQKHAELYARDEGFDDTFGPLVATVVDDFLKNHDPACERGWIAQKNGDPLGSIFCVRGQEGMAKLRLFFLIPEARGFGLGQHLLDTCMGFAHDAGYPGMRLWTHESHTAACALYAQSGWRCIQSKPVHSFGQNLVEQTWEILF